jgi:3-methyladenine DNA glycosylase/8-oxoguanine DNA glycosylase
MVEGEPGVLELGPAHDDHVLLRAHLPYWDGLIHVVERARRIFSLDAPVDDAAAHLAAVDPGVIGPLVAARPGIRVPGTWDAFETAVRAVVGQQVSVAGATIVMGRLVQRLGRPVPGLEPLGLTHAFPSPKEVAAGDLAGVGLTTSRAAAVQALAAAVDAGDVRLDRSVGLDELVASLCGLRGVGPWTAHYTALRLGERDAFPSGDLGLRRADERRTQAPGQAPAQAPALDEAAERWSPWRATAAVHLWLAP